MKDVYLLLYAFSIGLNFDVQVSCLFLVQVHVTGLTCEAEAQFKCVEWHPPSSCFVSERNLKNDQNVPFKQQFVEIFFCLFILVPIQIVFAKAANLHQHAKEILHKYVEKVTISEIWRVKVTF